MKSKTGDNIKQVDCALIFMLEEEQELFLKNNKDFIIIKNSCKGFKEFCFFDKSNQYRTGVMCSNGKEMGNTEACKLFYKISRCYSASLYINLGVAGLVADVNIGDVIVIDRLSTSGEHNDNISKTQIKDYNNLNSDKIKDLCYLINLNMKGEFEKITINKVSEFKTRLKRQKVRKYSGFDGFEHNKIVSGWCLTVPQVIKDKSRYDAITDQRKLNIVDMEAYYLASWYSYVQDNEPSIMQSNSSFLVFKSVSDYGDKNKHKFEKAGSRELAMHNLYAVVSNYCTNIHEFPLESSSNLYEYFFNNISKKCIDRLASNNLVEKGDIENLFKKIIHIDAQYNDSIIIESSITSILNNLEKNSQMLLLTGRSGTGKSTFISFLFKEAKGEKVLIDFSKYTDEEGVVLANLLDKLIDKNSNCLVFLDGVSPQSQTYHKVKTILFSSKDKKITFCIGGVDETIDSIETILNAKENFYKIYFSGINIYSESFESFIDEWFVFSRKIGLNSHDSKKVSLLIKNDKFNSVDLRLLNMFADYNNELPEEKLPVFIKTYIIDKYNENELSNCWRRYLLIEKHSKKIEENQYCNSVAITNGIMELFQSEKFTITDDIKAFIKRDFILSDDMNLILEHDLTYLKKSNVVIDNIIKLLTHKITDCRNNYDINISVETQLIYNVCRVIDSNDIKYCDFKNHIKKRVETLGNKMLNGDFSDIQKFIQYRTLCIVESLYFSNEEYLGNFNEIILNPSTGFVDYNLIFYLYYYSKREFSFFEIINFNFQNTDYEMFCNTFFVLRKIICSNDIVDAFLQRRQFFITNVITFTQLVYKIQIKSKQFDEFLEESKEILTSLQKGLDVVIKRYSSTNANDILFRLKEQVDLLMKEL